MRASPSDTVSSPGSGLPPYSMNSIMSSWARGLISSPSRDPTRGSPPSTEYVTSFKGSPLLGPRHNDTHLSSKADPKSISAGQHFSLSACCFSLVADRFWLNGQFVVGRYLCESR